VNRLSASLLSTETLLQLSSLIATVLLFLHSSSDPMTSK